MKRLLVFLLAGFSASNLNAQIGIGTTSPLARLHVVDSNVLFSAAGAPPATSGRTPVSGAGRRLMWYADKAAFRAGYVTGTQWDQAGIGYYSLASGFNTTANGESGSALGRETVASGNVATAIGLRAVASGLIAISMGYESLSSGISSISIGEGVKSTGRSSLAMGVNTTSSANASVAMGSNTNASGNNSTATGESTISSGDYSSAIGNFVSTSGFLGSFAIGDFSRTTITSNDASNQMMTRFAGGYKLFSNPAATVGVQIAPGGNAWVTISDINRKENFAPVNAEEFLERIARFNLVSWNYKGQTSGEHRHYGPMAQEFYQAFGKDDYGTIGNDTTINQADFDGVNFIAIQALEKRTTDLKKQNEELKKENDLIKLRLAKLEALFDKQLISHETADVTP